MEKKLETLDWGRKNCHGENTRWATPTLFTPNVQEDIIPTYSPLALTFYETMDIIKSKRTPMMGGSKKEWK